MYKYSGADITETEYNMKLIFHDSKSDTANYPQLNPIAVAIKFVTENVCSNIRLKRVKFTTMKRASKNSERFVLAAVKF